MSAVIGQFWNFFIIAFIFLSLDQFLFPCHSVFGFLW